MLKRALALTTINGPNTALQELALGSSKLGCDFFITGDVKSPPDFELSGAKYLTIDQQVEKYPSFCSHLPLRHYTRKNIAYLEAMKTGVDCIQETDDDNIPNPEFWAPLEENIQVTLVKSTHRWLNVYELFSDASIWPRGIPLEHIAGAKEILELDCNVASRGLIRQGLADRNPDVDAVFRLTRTLPLSFNRRSPVLLASGSWCPFNSQNTVFLRDVFPLLYLPSKCTFRMTDIWRSFVAQRCLWEMGEGVVFHNATVYQERNEHNLLRDFEDEIPGYLNNDKLARSLSDLKLTSKDPLTNLVACYEHLISEAFFPTEELSILYAWCREIEHIDIR